MPRILPYEQRTSAQVGSLGPGPVAQPFSAGKLMSAIGQELGNVADVFHQDAIARGNDAATRLDEAAEQLLRDEANNVTPGAEGFTPGALKKFDDLSRQMETEAREGASVLNRRKVTEYVKLRSANLRTRFEGRAKEFEAVERVRYRSNLFTKSADRLRTTLELDPDRWAKSVAEQLHAIESAGMSPIATAKARAQLQEAAGEGAALGYASKEPQAALAELRNPDSTHPIFVSLSSSARERVLARAESQVETQGAQAVLKEYGRDVVAGDRALEALQASDMPEEQRDGVRRRVREGLGLLYSERKRVHVEELADLERSIERGAVGPDAESNAQQLYRQNALSAEEYANTNARIERGRVLSAAQTAEAEGIAQALASGERLDPRSKAHRKFVDSALAQSVQAIGVDAGSPQWQAASLDLTLKTGVVPSQAQSWLRSAALSPNVETAAQSARFLDSISTQAPQTLEFIDDKTKSFGMQVSQMIAAGTSPQDAVATVRKAVFEVGANERTALEKRYREETKDSAGTLRSMLNSDDDYDPTLFGSAPAVPAGMQGDFDALTSSYYQTTGGNLSTARQLAYRDLQTRWGRSEANGAPEIMRYAPERFGIPGSLVRQEIDAAFGERAANIRVVPDADTGRAMLDPLTGQVKPVSYRLVEIDPQTGFLDVLPDRYVLPSQTDLDARVSAERAKRVDRAKRQSQANAAKARAVIEEARRFPLGSAAQQDMAALRTLRPAEIEE